MSSFADPRCRDSRSCCFRNLRNKTCTILTKSYDNSARDCPFRKPDVIKPRNDIKHYGQLVAKEEAE